MRFCNGNVYEGEFNENELDGEGSNTVKLG